MRVRSKRSLTHAIKKLLPPPQYYKEWTFGALKEIPAKWNLVTAKYASFRVQRPTVAVVSHNSNCNIAANSISPTLMVLTLIQILVIFLLIMIVFSNFLESSSLIMILLL